MRRIEIPDPRLTDKDGSPMTLRDYGAETVVDRYDVMDPVKAAP